MTAKFASDEGRVFLRALSPEDVTEEYVSWFSNPWVTMFFDARTLTMADCQTYIRTGQKHRAYFMYGIFDAQNSRHIGNLKVGPIN